MQRGLGGFPHERLHQDSAIIANLTPSTNQVIGKYFRYQGF
ncbi:hypothetical protein [Moorena bouillonii]|nr:hypothetical protein [Moorena bouillonii]